MRPLRPWAAICEGSRLATCLFLCPPKPAFSCLDNSAVVSVQSSLPACRQRGVNTEFQIRSKGAQLSRLGHWVKHCLRVEGRTYVLGFFCLTFTSGLFFFWITSSEFNPWLEQPLNTKTWSTWEHLILFVIQRVSDPKTARRPGPRWRQPHQLDLTAPFLPPRAILQCRFRGLWEHRSLLCSARHYTITREPPEPHRPRMPASALAFTTLRRQHATLVWLWLGSGPWGPPATTMTPGSRLYSQADEMATAMTTVTAANMAPWHIPPREAPGRMMEAWVMRGPMSKTAWGA